MLSTFNISTCTRPYIEEERRRLAREVELKREMEEQYAKRGTKQQREIREQEKKVQSLEKSLGQVVKDFEDEKVGMCNRLL